MFRLFGSPEKRNPSRLRTRRRPVRFESLEKRFCLAAPAITSFQIDSVDGTYVSVSGSVTDECPEMTQVDFEGALWGNTWPDAYGNFSYSGYAQSLGAITAVATDDEWLQSAPAEVELTNNPPTLQSLSISYGYRTNLTISGQVIDEDPGNLAVYISGVVQGVVMTDSNGYFSLDVVGRDLGEVEIEVYDIWGQQAYDTIDVTGNNPPTITNYYCQVDSGGILTVDGYVVDEDPAGLSVMFEFMSNIYNTTTDTFGRFMWHKQLDLGDEGDLLTWVYDWWELSDAVLDYVMYV